MKILKDTSTSAVLNECQRPQLDDDQIIPLISEVFNEVATKGDEAVRKYTRFFDKIDLKNFNVPKTIIDAAEQQISEDLKIAIKKALLNIETFHAAQSVSSVRLETSAGVECWQESRPIDTVGIYIPGGTAPLFSTVLMLAAPAKIAGCKRIVLCTPPDVKGEINPAILFAASITGVSEVYAVGGSQAIAAMALGTESIPKVDKIFGPGNQFVTAAKTKAQQFGVAIDMPAGPSELLVYADETAIPAFVASDLLSQAEHGIDSQVICLVDSESLANKVLAEIKTQLNDLPRKEIAQKSLDQSRMIVVKNQSQALEIINDYAPEHLILCVDSAEELVSQINNAGSVFIGNYTPESAGDYASGTNHTLPTARAAKAYSGVNLDAFQKKITFQKITKQGIKDLGKTIELMAEAEQLQAHKNAVTIRLKQLKNENRELTQGEYSQS